jgi:hypothetical protein
MQAASLRHLHHPQALGRGRPSGAAVRETNRYADVDVSRRPLISARAVFVRGKAGGVAAGPRQACNEAATDRVTDIHERDRDGAGRLQQWCLTVVPLASTNSAANLRTRRHYQRPSDSPSARYGRRSSSIPGGTAGTPRCAPAIPDRLQRAA